MFDIPFEYSEAFTFVMYLAPAIISLVVLGIVKRKLIWLSIPITIFADLIAFWSVLIYYESRGLALVFLIPQVFVVTAISAVFMYRNKKHKGDKT